MRKQALRRTGLLLLVTLNSSVVLTAPSNYTLRIQVGKRAPVNEVKHWMKIFHTA